MIKAAYFCEDTSLLQAKIRRLYHLMESPPINCQTNGLISEHVRFWLRTTEVDKPHYKPCTRPSLLDDYKPTLDSWLKSNAHRSKRERRTTLGMYHDLKVQGYQGSVSLVYRYIRASKETPSSGLKRAFMPLQFEYGEAVSLTGVQSLPGLHAHAVNSNWPI